MNNVKNLPPGAGLDLRGIGGLLRTVSTYRFGRRVGRGGASKNVRIFFFLQGKSLGGLVR